MPFERYRAYLSDVAADLTDSSQIIQGSHPFFRTQSCFSRKVMEMCDKPLEDVGETRICTLRIDADGILSNVVDG